MNRRAIRECLHRLLGIPAERGELNAEKRGEIDLGQAVGTRSGHFTEPGASCVLS